MTNTAVGSDAARLERIKRRFAEFAAEFAALPIYSALCLRVREDDEMAALLLHARPGQDRPVLWLAALHELVLRRPDVPAARWYASVVGRGHPCRMATRGPTSAPPCSTTARN